MIISSKYGEVHTIKYGEVLAITMVCYWRPRKPHLNHKEGKPGRSLETRGQTWALQDK